MNRDDIRTKLGKATAITLNGPRTQWWLGVIAVAWMSVGCRPKPVENHPSPIGVKTTAPGDKETALYRKLRSADVQVDSAIQELSDALEGSKKLAPRAGGDAEKALLSVVEQLDQAGEALGDYENSPESVDEYKKDFSAQDERRLRSIKILLDADKDANDASNVLNDLSHNVPDGFKKDLNEINQGVNDALSDLEGAVTSMGGKVPDDGVTESIDPAQDSAQSAGGESVTSKGHVKSRKSPHSTN